MKKEYKIKLLEHPFIYIVLLSIFLLIGCLTGIFAVIIVLICVGVAICSFAYRITERFIRKIVK